MKHNYLAVTVVALLVGCGVAALAWAQEDGPTSSVRFVVVRDTDGKPVRNAQVVLHPVKRNSKQASGELELKTDADGKASIDGIPYGVLRVQVLMPHFQTFGDDFEINKPELEIAVKLKHPNGQYSTYDNHGDDKKPQ